MRYVVLLQINHRPDGEGRATFQAEPDEYPSMVPYDWRCNAIAPDVVHYSRASTDLDKLVRSARRMMLTLGFRATEQIPAFTPAVQNVQVSLTRHHWHVDLSEFDAA